MTVPHNRAHALGTTEKTPIAIVLGLTLLVVAGIWFWGVLTGYVSPKDAGDRKDVVQTFALITAGLVGAIGGIVGIANLQTSRRSLKQQRELEQRRAQEDALLAYFAQMGVLLTDYELVSTDREDIRQLAQAHTHIVLARVDGDLKASVMRFLHGATLIKRSEGEPIVDLLGANLRDIEFQRGDLSHAHLRAAYFSCADFEGSDLSHADLSASYFWRANFEGAALTSADLPYADLTDANISDEQLLSAADLGGATMPDERELKDFNNPDRPTLEEWIKSKSR